MNKEVVSKLLPEVNENTKWRFWSRVNLLANPFQCWDYNGYKHRGYGKFSITTGPQRDTPVIAHRLAYFLYYGIDPVGFAVMHICDNPSCCNPNHFLLGTNKDNTDDMLRKKRGGGFFKKGIDHPKSKLTEENVLDILLMHSSGKKQKKIAMEYSVNPSLISRIIRGEYWSHIKKQTDA